MSAVDSDSVVHEARSIVRAARKAGPDTLEELTPRVVRERIAGKLGIDAAILSKGELKKLIKTTIDEALDEDAAPSSPAKPVSPQGNKRKSAGEETHERASKKAKVDKEDGKTQGNKKKEGAKEKITPAEKKPGKKVEKKPAKVDVDHNKDFDTAKSDSEMSVVIDEGPAPKKKGKGKSKAAVEKKPKKVEEEDEAANAGSDSEMSVVIDDGPAPKKKGKGKAKEKDDSKPSKERKPKKEKIVLSKDEETIKQLKSFVVACGVRKMWSKEFKDMDKPSQQIAHLKKLLSDLGMTGRLSLEKAKSIRARRELEQEAADVMSFERQVTNPRRSSAAEVEPKNAEATDSDDEEADENEGPPLKRSRGGATRSIMKFLEDQSDDD